MKKIDENTLNALLQLSRLSPECADLSTLTAQVNEIAEYFDKLSVYDSGENPYDAYPSSEVEKLRDSTVAAGLAVRDIKKISDEFMDGYFRVPKVLGGGA